MAHAPRAGSFADGLPPERGACRVRGAGARARLHGDFGVSFEVALAATRAGNVFTTHTPVSAGFDRFPPELVEAQLGSYVRKELGLTLDQFMALGRARRGDPTEPLNMAWLAARTSGAINAVSRRHGTVSRQIFAPLFPRVPEAEVPIGHVTNGVHVPSWDSAEADALWTKACGAERWRGTMESVSADIASRSDAELWQLRGEARRKLVTFVRERLGRQLAASGIEGPALEAAGGVFNEDVLTIGLARRFASYKRPTLLLHDHGRFARLLQQPGRPVQLVIAGKAHPQDSEGKSLVAEWVRFARESDVRPHAVFLEDYDLRLAERLVQGVDLWINTPRPPWEACGTSGMKILVNGGLNLSFLDGWWDEAYRPEVGWAPAGDGRDDAADAVRLYELLERDVIPTFYDRDPEGLPRRWITKMRSSMANLTPLYSANRALREYCERYYLQAADAFVRAQRAGRLPAAALVAVRETLDAHWGGLRFGEVRVHSEDGHHRIAAAVYHDDMDPDLLAVELYADAHGRWPPARVPMQRTSALVGARGFTYVAEVSDTRPAQHYTPRIVPALPEAPWVLSSSLSSSGPPEFALHQPAPNPAAPSPPGFGGPSTSQLRIRFLSSELRAQVRKARHGLRDRRARGLREPLRGPIDIGELRFKLGPLNLGVHARELKPRAHLVAKGAHEFEARVYFLLQLRGSWGHDPPRGLATLFVLWPARWVLTATAVPLLSATSPKNRSSKSAGASFCDGGQGCAQSLRRVCSCGGSRQHPLRLAD